MFSATCLRAHEFVTYLNVEQVMSLVGPFLALVPQTAGAFQKLSRIQATASSFAFADKQIQDVGFTAYSSESKPPPVTQRKTLALTSPQTSVYAVQSSDLGGMYQEIMDSIAQSGNASLISSAAQFDQRLRSGGLHIREDLLSFLGPETALVVTWRDGATIPDAALVAEIRNATQTRPRLDLALNALKEIALGSNERVSVGRNAVPRRDTPHRARWFKPHRAHIRNDRIIFHPRPHARLRPRTARSTQTVEADARVQRDLPASDETVARQCLRVQLLRPERHLPSALRTPAIKLCPAATPPRLSN